MIMDKAFMLYDSCTLMPMRTVAERIPLTIVSIAVISLSLISNCIAQTAADHAAQAHGKPIVRGHPVQPTPDVVQERWRHHEEMLRSEDGQSTGTPSASPSQSHGTTTEGVTPNSGTR